MIKELEGYQRAELFRHAHHVRPVASVGKEGLTEAVLEHIKRELEHRELIKIRFTDFKAVRREMMTDIADACGGIVVGVIGHIGILYREADDPAERTIRIPTRP